MITLLSDPDARLIWRIMIVFAVLVVGFIVTVALVEQNHQQQLLKEKRQRLLKKEDEACGQYILDQNEEFRRDFDDAS